MEELIFPNDSILAIIQENVGSAIESYLPAKINTIDNSIKWVIYILAANIILYSVRWFLDYMLKMKEVKVSRETMIEEKRIKSETILFNKINSLFSTLEWTDGTFERKYQAAIEFRDKNALYLKKKYIVLTNKIFDYMLKVQENPSNKDIEKEDDFLEKYIKIFNG